ncbi:toll-like receptor 13 [Chanodichthys erythropterus]|uniref:toll-like receptor 13 n=1 Tax=Chanodichthys erythropterus TaxID=933992 RepID=UPI00351E0573
MVLLFSFLILSLKISCVSSWSAGKCLFYSDAEEFPITKTCAGKTNAASCDHVTDIKEDLRELPSNLRNLCIQMDGSLAPDSFARFVSLDYLEIHGCFSEIPPEAFNGLTNVTSLSLTKLSSKGCCEVALDFSRLPSLNTLLLSKYRLSLLAPNFFETIPHLQNLYLFEVCLKDISEVLCRLENVKSLKEFNLNEHTLNRLQNLTLVNIANHELRPNDFQSLCASDPQIVKQLSFMFLRSNKIDEIVSYKFMCFTNLETLDLSLNIISNIEDFAFIGLNNLKELYLCSNKLSYIYQQTFRGLYGLMVLDLQENPIIEIESNSFGHLISLITLLLGDLNFPPDMSPIKLHLFDIFGIIPYNLSNILISSGLRPMQLVIGSNTTLDQALNLHIKGQYPNLAVMFHNLTKLQTLILANCRFFFLDGSLTKDLKALRGLVLVLKDNVNVLQNLVEHLTSLKYLNLQGLGLYCSCDNAWLLSWVKNNRNVQVNMFNPTMKELQCLSDNGIDHLNFIGYAKENCSFEIEFVFFASTSALLCIFIIVVLSYKFAGQYIAPFYHIASGWFRDALRGNGKHQYRYDVFVSYSAKDEHWVMEELLPNLERRGPPFLRLCLHSRDFQLGEDIVENITDSIYASRQTLCLVSRNYLSSNWCSLEMQLATYRLQVEHRDILILVFLEMIPSRWLSSHHRLARLVKTRTYLDWPQDPEMHEAFWDRLWCKLSSNKAY